MEWWMIGIGVVVVLVLIYFLTRYLDKDEEAGVEKFSEMIKKGKVDKVKKKAKDSMEVYEAFQLAAKTKGD